MSAMLESQCDWSRVGVWQGLVGGGWKSQEMRSGGRLGEVNCAWSCRPW